VLERAEYAWAGTDDDLRELVSQDPWVTLVSSTSRGLVVSHLPVVTVPEAPGLEILGHLARTDAEEHELGERDTVVVVQGRHGYISPGWYVGGPYVPTWNFVVAHLHGRPSVLDADETYDVLDRTVDHFESVRPTPFRLDSVAAYAARLAPAVVGFRLTPTRVVAKAKLSQDKPEQDRAGVLRGLEDPSDVHHDPALAAAMRTGGIPARAPAPVGDAG
jgi:transcriptional regulator